MKFPVVLKFQNVLLFLIAAVNVGCTAKVKLLAPEDALEGEDVILRCEYAIQDQDIYSVRWYKGSREFLRVINSDLPDQQIFKVSGVKIDLEDGVTGSRKVVLKDLESRTTGRYRCKLALKPLSFNQTLISKPVKLLVKPLQVLVGSLDGPQYLRRGVDGHLVCACGGDQKEDGTRALVWSYVGRNGNPKEFAKMVLTQQQQQKPNQDIKYTQKQGINVDVSRSNSERLVLKRVGRRTSGTYVCQVIKAGSVMCNHTAFIRIIDAPVMGPFSFPPSISVGRPVSAICSVTDGHRPFSISFKKDGVPLKKELAMTLDGFTSQLLIPVTALEDSGVYTCSASNPIGKATTSATLNVFRRLHITSLVVPSVTKTGTDTDLYCNFAPRMDAHTVTWIANNEPIFAYYLHNNTKEFLKETSLTINVDKSNGTVLSLHNVRPQNSGHYTCKVQGSHAHLNGVQDKQSQHMSVTESGIEAEAQIVFLGVPSHVPKGKDVELYCEIDLLKYSLYEVNWYHNDNTIFRYVPQNKEEPKIVFPNEGINVNESSTANVLILQDIDVDATGTYSCEATINGPPFTTASRSANMTVIESSLEMSLTVPEEVAEGEDVELRCEFQDRAGVALSWFHNDEMFFRASLNGRKFRFLLVSPDTSVDVQASTGRLVVLRDVNQSHSGVYRCEVTTAPDLMIAARSAMMTVRGSRVTLTSQEGPQYLLQGSVATLSCPCVITGWMPAVVTWMFGDTTIMVATTKDNNVTTTQMRDIHIDNTESSAGNLVLRDMSWDTSGDYTCTVQYISESESQSVPEECRHTATIIFLGRAKLTTQLERTAGPSRYYEINQRHGDTLQSSRIGSQWPNHNEKTRENNENNFIDAENQDGFEIGNVLGIFSSW